MRLVLHYLAPSGVACAAPDGETTTDLFNVTCPDCRDHYADPRDGSDDE